MANLTPNPSMDAVPQNETSTIVQGGPGGPMNLQAQALLNRTAYLNGKFNDLANATDPVKGPALIGYDPALNYAVGTLGYRPALEKAFARTLPLTPLIPPAQFNDQLKLLRFYDGVNVVYNVDPYDAIDFTKNPDTTINHYYVDYVNGNNANAGTSAGAGNAWKTLDKANASAVSPAVIHLMDEWVGYQNRVTNPLTWNGKFKFVSGHSSGETRAQGTRESYTKATFVWLDEGGGTWSTSTATTTSTIFADMGHAMFDAKHKDADGIAMPIPDVGSSAACIATPGTQYNDAAASKKWVHLIDGRTPDPYDGWIYCRIGNNWQDIQSSDTGVLLYENIRVYANSGTSSTANFRYRHSTTAQNNSRVGKKNCSSSGSSSNGFETYDAKICAFSNCIARYNHTDNFNYHSFVATGTKGEWITVYEYKCKSSEPGYQGFTGQPALSTSANGSTSHDSMHVERMSCDHGGGNGATIADVNGVVSINWKVNAGPATGTGSPKACFWHDNYLRAGTNSGMWLWGCAGHDGGDSAVTLCDNTAQGAGQTGQIYVKYWRGQTDGAVVGTLKDFAGNNI